MKAVRRRLAIVATNKPGPFQEFYAALLAKGIRPTVDDQTPEAFEPSLAIADINAHEGDVEDWIVENRTQELRAFHIHQIHFMLLQWFGLPVNEPYLRDMINVPFWDGKTSAYPVVKLQMDFRDPNSVGTFVYHCHLLEHEDGGMMGLIRVEPKNK